MSLTSTAQCEFASADTSADYPSTLPRRIVALVIGLACLTVLIIAAILQPSPEGYGTHTAMGLKACGLLERTGVPCPTCGMTTSFAHAADGNLPAAFITQPAGAALAILTAMTVLICLYVVMTGRDVWPWLRPLFTPVVIIGSILFLVSAWIYKIIITI